jgi:hypothetical protein
MTRAYRYKMMEIELAARVSAPRLFFTRIGILCGANLVALFILRGALQVFSAWANVAAQGLLVYLALPYLVSCLGCLLITTYSRGKQNSFACTIFCGFLAFLFFALYEVSPDVYAASAINGWYIGCAACLLCLLFESMHILRRIRRFESFAI